MKKVIIISATSGIGRALAKQYAQNNWVADCKNDEMASNIYL